MTSQSTPEVTNDPQATIDLVRKCQRELIDELKRPIPRPPVLICLRAALADAAPYLADRLAAADQQQRETEKLRAALVRMRSILKKLQPALNVMAREVLDDIIADQIDAVLNATKEVRDAVSGQ